MRAGPKANGRLPKEDGEVLQPKSQNRSYKPGDLVLKKLLPVRKNPAHGKLGPSWEGPYIMTRVIRLGNYELQTEEGKILPHTWNAEHLKRFYQ